jgi:murein DD-endopeptidase MepM/ murein hydrolase activator NlpD
MMENSVLTNSYCGRHLNPLITKECEYEEGAFQELLEDNYLFYTDKLTNTPNYEFKVLKGEKTKIEAFPKEGLSIYGSDEEFAVGITSLIDVWPSSSKTLSSCYGKRTLEIDGEEVEDYTDGIDIKSDSVNQSRVYAVESGRVYSVCKNTCNIISDSSCEKTCSGFGTNIVIIHPEGFLTRYSHLDAGSVSVTEGQTVNKGDFIALAGNTGFSLGDHLDFKLYSGVDDLGKKDTALSPFCFFDKQVTQGLKFSASAESCTTKYPEGIDLDNPPIALLQECQNNALGTTADTEKLADGVIQRSKRYDSIIF